jgi:branched-chain amino acid transport system substrate-binding protein
MLSRRTLLAPSAATLAAPRLLRAQPAAPGVTAAEIKIGNIMP